MAIVTVTQINDLPNINGVNPPWRWWVGVTATRLFVGPLDVEFAAVLWIDYQGINRRETVKSVHRPFA